jgi:hypothetical protein
MSKDIDLEDIKTLVQECVKNNKIDFLSNLVFVLQNNYKDLAIICTDGNYHEGWSHSKVLDYVTYELN